MGGFLSSALTGGLLGLDPVTSGIVGSALGSKSSGAPQYTGANASGHWDTYLQQNPDVAASWQSLGNNQRLYSTIQDYAAWHYNTYGKKEGRKSGDELYTAQQADPNTKLPVEQQLGNYVVGLGQKDIAADAQRATDAQNLIASYQPQIAATNKLVSDMTVVDPKTGKTKMLTGELAQSGQAAKDQQALLTKQLATQQKSLDTDVAAQRKSLSDMIKSLGTNLTGELKAKADALQKQLDTLNSASTTLTAQQQAALQQQITTNTESLNTEVTSRKDALAAELSTMQGAIGTEADARRAALSTELDGLNSAQAPLNAARESAAQAQVTAVNLGLESQRDQIQAQAAQDGFIGSSTGTDASLVRATVGARQQGAQAVGSARVQNAGDTADIAKYGATKGASIAEDAASKTTGVTNFGAGETRGIADYGSAQQRALTDYGASENRGISTAGSQRQYDISSYGAGENRSLSNYGAEQTRSIADTNAKQDNAIDTYASTNQRALTDYGAEQTRGIGDTAIQRNLGYFDADVARRLQGLNMADTAIKTQIGIKDLADTYSQSGLNRTMSNLGWFATNTTPPSTSAYYQNPNTATGDAWQSIGAGVTSLGGQVALNKWFSPTATAAVPAASTALPSNSSMPTFNGTIGSFNNSLYPTS